MNYSEDEFVALVFGIAVAVPLWGMWYYALGRTRRTVRPTGNRQLLGVAPVFCALLILVVLHRWAAEDVRNDEAYVFLYLILGAAWLGLFEKQLPLWGLSTRDDVLERGNDAASWSITGALIAGACCFAGANVGNGPGWWVVVFSAGLSTVSLLSLWFVVHLASGLAEKVTLDRDASAGLRAAGFFIGSAFILGRAVAGDWVSTFATTADFAGMSWPALVLAGAAVAVERCCVPDFTGSRKVLIVSGWVPACLYVLAGAIVLLTV